jgi:hypothetical protein
MSKTVISFLVEGGPTPSVRVGFVDLTNTGNAGLESSDHVLTLLYKTSKFADGGLISEVLNMADFAAWSYIAALRFTALLQKRGNGVAIVPDIPITFGRPPAALW